MNHKKIAELAHVSPSTVSKALSGSGEISPEIAKMVQKIAIEAGYFKEKSKRKREYTNNKSLIIAVIVPEIIGVYYASLIHCIKSEVESLGGNVAIFISDFNQERANELLRTIILHGTADGVIMFGSPTVDEPNIPMLCITSKQQQKHDFILHNSQQALDKAVGFLKELGHKKLGFVGEPLTRGKVHCFRAAVEKNGLQIYEDYIYNINNRFEAGGIEAAHRILSSENRPTAIIAAYDVIAMALVHELTKNGVKVPEDISVMGINNIATTSYAGIPLSTVEEIFPEVFREAIGHLFDRIINESHEIKSFSLEHRVVVRESTMKI